MFCRTGSSDYVRSFRPNLRPDEVDQRETWVEGFSVKTAVNRMDLKMLTDLNYDRLEEDLPIMYVPSDLTSGLTRWTSRRPGWRDSQWRPP